MIGCESNQRAYSIQWQWSDLDKDKEQPWYKYGLWSFITKKEVYKCNTSKHALMEWWCAYTETNCWNITPLLIFARVFNEGVIFNWQKKCLKLILVILSLIQMQRSNLIYSLQNQCAWVYVLWKTEI